MMFTLCPGTPARLVLGEGGRAEMRPGPARDGHGERAGTELWMLVREAFTHWDHSCPGGRVCPGAVTHIVISEELLKGTGKGAQA